MSYRACWLATLIGTAASVAYVAGLATQSLLVGYEPGAWAYRYVQPFSIHLVFVGLLAAAAAGSALLLPAGASGRRERLLVAAWIAIALALYAFIRSVTPFSFETIFASDGANSFYTVTERHDPLTVLRDFNRVRRDAPIHAQSNMPGKLMFLFGLRLLSARPDVLPWLMVVASTLGGVLMYVFVRQLLGDRLVALYALVLYLFVPGKLVFLPLMNTVTVVPVLACLCIFMRWLQTGSPGWAALLGVGLYVLAVFEPLPLVLGIVFAALTVSAIARGWTTWPRFVLQTCVMAVAFVATAELVQWGFGFNLVGSFVRLREHAAAFNATEGRPYATWIWANLWEFVFSVGVCQVVLFLCAAVAALTETGTVRERLTRPAAALCLSLLGVLLAVDAVGINRGEVVRLWIFLACLFQIPVAVVCARLQRPAAIILVVATSIVQAAIGTGMIGFLVP